jgi:hypothetical protein
MQLLNPHRKDIQGAMKAKTILLAFLIQITVLGCCLLKKFLNQNKHAAVSKIVTYPYWSIEVFKLFIVDIEENQALKICYWC